MKSTHTDKLLYTLIYSDTHTEFYDFFITTNLQEMQQLTISVHKWWFRHVLCGTLYNSSRVPLVTSNYTTLQCSYKKDHIKGRSRVRCIHTHGDREIEREVTMWGGLTQQFTFPVRF